jgi:hypothetical protein
MSHASSGSGRPLIKNWGCPADLLTNQTVLDRNPRPHLEGTAGRDRTHDTTRPYTCMYGELKDVSRFRAFGPVSDAEHGFTSMRYEGRTVSTPQECKKQTILDLSQIPAPDHSSFQRGSHCGQRTYVKCSSTSMCFYFASEVSLISSKGTIYFISFFRLHRIFSGLLTIVCTQVTIQEYTMIRWETLWS